VEIQSERTKGGVSLEEKMTEKTGAEQRMQETEANQGEQKRGGGGDERRGECGRGEERK
jgi:hypothetical protein